MAINFSASFAACLAAGLKVPRQFMYCISQDTGQPYVLYKDSQEVVATTTTAATGQWTEVYPVQQQQYNQQEPVEQAKPAQNGAGKVCKGDKGAGGRLLIDSLNFQVPQEQQQLAAVNQSNAERPNYFAGPQNAVNVSFEQHYPIPDLLTATNQAETSTTATEATPSDSRQFPCPTCGKDFKQKSTMLQHKRIHNDARPFGCTECGKRFRQQSHLSQHLRIHTNEKPFACPYCASCFRQRAILNQHVRIHSGERPFKCDYCQRGFHQKTLLSQHRRTHQGRPLDTRLRAIGMRLLAPVAWFEAGDRIAMASLSTKVALGLTH